MLPIRFKYLDPIIEKKQITILRNLKIRNKTKLLTELAERFLKEYLQYFLHFFYRTSKLKIGLNLKQYYNSRFNEKIIKSFKNIIKLTLFVFVCILYMFNTN